MPTIHLFAEISYRPSHLSGQHKDHKEIGHKNWLNYEVAKSKEHKNKLVAVKLDKSNESPEELLNSGASWAMSFTQDSIVKALDNAAK